MNVERWLGRLTGRSLMRRLVLTITVVHALMMGVFVTDLVGREREMLSAQTRSALLEEVALLSRSGREWLLARDLAGLEELLQSVRNSPGIEYAMYLEPDGRVLVHSEGDKAGLALGDAVSRAALAEPAGEGARLIQSNSELSDALAPVRYGEQLIGWVRVARNHEREHSALAAVITEGATYVLAAVVISALLAVLVARGLTADLRRARALFGRVREGDLTARIVHQRQDELGALLDGVNDMLDSLARNELMLRQTRERLELAVEGANDGVWDWDLGSNTVYYSARWKSMLGFAESELGDRPDTFFDRVHPDDFSLLLNRVTDYLQGRVPVFEIIVRLHHRNGGWRWILSRGVAQRNAAGEAYRMSGTHTDITALKEAEDGRALERSRLYSLLEQMFTGIVMEDADGRIALCNQAFCNLLPIAEKPSDLIGRLRDEVLPAALPLFADPEVARQRIEQIVLSGEAVVGEPVRLADGRVMERDCVPIRVGDVEQGRLWTFRDISSRIKLENSLAAEKERLRVTLLSIGDAVISTGEDGQIDFLNPVAEGLTGWSNAEAAGRPLGQVLKLLDAHTRAPRPDPASEALQEKSIVQLDGDTLLVSRLGDERMVEDSAAPIRDARGVICGAVVVFRDATDRHRMQERLRWQATHDPLTGLANRLLLEDRLTQAMARARRQDRLLAVCILDLDDFKRVNDTLGHEAGDELLLSVAQRLTAVVRLDDTIARLGGDEFVVLLGALPDLGEMDACVQRMLAAISVPVTVRGEEVATHASIGVTLYPMNDSDADTLLRHADQAMYAAKQSGGRCYRLFDFEYSQAAVDRMRRKERVGEGITRGEMCLYYQPRVDMREGRMISVEALVRWQHPEEGILVPDRFLPLIEDDPEIHRLGEWVIRTALDQMTRWRADGARFGVSVNISAPHLLAPGFVTRLSGFLAEYPALPRDVLEIEVVESVALNDIEHAASVVSEIRRLGVRVAIDDFGVGYASLGYLRRLPVDVVKIDKSFVVDMLEDEDDLEVVQAVIALAHALRREAVAEGVETAEHGLLLLRLGCHLVQGYGIARPMPAADLLQWSRSWRPDTRWLEWRDFTWDLDDLPLFVAARDFNGWVDRVLKLADGQTAALSGEEVRDSTRCRFGQWFHGLGHVRYRGFAEYDELDVAHRKLHEQGGRVLDCIEAGDLPSAQTQAAELSAVREEVSVLIDALQKSARRRATAN